MRAKTTRTRARADKSNGPDYRDRERPAERPDSYSRGKERLSDIDAGDAAELFASEDMDGNTTIISKAADLAAGLGIVVVNSAGNEGYNSSHNTLGAPADGDSVFSIGAVTSSGTRTSFSSVGPTVDGRIKPDLMAMGSNVFYASSFGNQYWSGGGTSFSCPLVAGVCALILQKNPSSRSATMLQRDFFTKNRNL